MSSYDDCDGYDDGGDYNDCGDYDDDGAYEEHGPDDGDDDDDDDCDTNDNYDAHGYQSEDPYVDDYTVEETLSDTSFPGYTPPSTSYSSTPYTNYPGTQGRYEGNSFSNETRGNSLPFYTSPTNESRDQGSHTSDADDENSPSEITSTPTIYTPNTSTNTSQSGQTYNKPYTITAHGINSQSNHWCNRDYGPNVPNKNSYHYSNRDGSYYYANSDGSTYYNNGRGGSWYTPPAPCEGRK